jgi:hypothetical protein
VFLVSILESTMFTPYFVLANIVIDTGCGDTIVRFFFDDSVCYYVGAVSPFEKRINKTVKIFMFSKKSML